MMKTTINIAITLVTLGFTNIAQAQIKGNQLFNGANIPSSSAFIDASVTNSINDPNYGKGMIFPRADLTKLVLANQGTLYNTGNNPNRFDGMIVYNTTTGTTPTTGSGVGNQAITAGFYYFSNPGNPTNLSGGRWIPFTGAAVNTKVNITDNTATITNLQFNGKDVMMQKGTFTTNGTTTAPTAYSSKVTIPAAGSVYRVTIFKAGTGMVYSNGVYSYDNTTGNIITGSPSISVVYPAGTYDYTVEYIN